MIQSLRGMNDTLAPENKKYLHLIHTASAIAARYGFEFIETPILEETALFKRSVGESSDIVGKEMYQFIDKGENDVCLRPEGTAGVVRSFIQNKFDKAGGKYKFFYHGPMFRYERPQKGRLRQFHQFGVESFGEASVFEDSSVILLLKDIFDALNIGYKVEINSLGCPKCMPPYRENLIKFITTHEAEICQDCVRRKNTNPIRVLDCKNESCQTIYQNAPKLLENLCSECEEDFKTLQALLKANGLEFVINSHLVRGLDYYSKTAFEFISDGIGAQNAIAGGGRYDRLIEYLGGKPTPGVGFALGMERILDLIELKEEEKEGYYFGAMDEQALLKVYGLGYKKRKKAKVHIEYQKRSFSKHLNLANKLGCRYCVIIGENELKDQTVWVKDLLEQKESTIKESELFS